MKNLVFSAILTLVVMAFPGLCLAGISLDPIAGPWDSDTLQCGVTVELRLRWDGSEIGPAEFITGSVNGFRLHDNGTGAEWSYSLGDSIGGVWNPAIAWGDYYDLGLWVDIFPDPLGGVISDTIGFLGARLFRNGIPSSFNDIFALIQVVLDCNSHGKQFCVDSSIVRPYLWIWSTTIGSYPPSWDGPHCFYIVDWCPLDPDGDGVENCNDNCPNGYNPNQNDSDNDGVGDVCDTLVHNVWPNTMYVFQAYNTDSLLINFRFGDIVDSHTVYDIDASTLLINGTLAPVSWSILPFYPGFTDEVMQADILMAPFILGYGPLFDTTTQTYTLEGLFDDATDFFASGEVVIVGHLSGDLNLDGTIDVSDLTYLVNFLFGGGPAPRLLQTADLDGSGTVDISDLSELVGYLFP